MEVVRLVRKTGCALMRRLSAMAACLDLPSPISWKALNRICTQSATARVRMTTGATEVAWFNLIPIQAISPTAVAADRLTTSRVAMVAETDRSNTSRRTTMIPYMAGVRVPRSFKMIRISASTMATRPVIATVKPGWAARSSAAMSSARAMEGAKCWV
jgi:hypothetical protein